LAAEDAAPVLSAEFRSTEMKATVLVVDDSKLARIVVGKAISALHPDWERVEAGNAEQAMELIAKSAG
jgi:hypothetical protein